MNLKAERTIYSIGIYMQVTGKVFDVLREKHGYFGYASYYLEHCCDKSGLKNKADVTIYKQLLEIDSKLGTTQSEQMRYCLCISPRKDLVEV